MSTQASPDVTIHHLNNSRSERLFWLLEELGHPYQVKVWYRAPMQAPPEMKKLHPLGKAPVITDHGKTLAESGAIVDYLLHKYPTSTFTGEYNEQSNFFSHYSEGSLMLFLQQTLTIGVMAERVPWYIRPIIQAFVTQVKSMYLLKEIQKHVEFMEGELRKSPTGWFGGGPEPSAGDFMMLYPVNSLLSADRFDTIKIGPELRAWMAKVEARPAYQRGMARLKEEEAKQKTEKVGGAEQSKAKSRL